MLWQAAQHSYALAAGLLTGTATVTSVATSVLSSPKAPPPPILDPPSVCQPPPRQGSMQDSILQAAQKVDAMWKQRHTNQPFELNVTGWRSWLGQPPALQGVWGGVASALHALFHAAAAAGVGFNMQALMAACTALRQQRWEAQALVLLCTVFLFVQGALRTVQCVRSGGCMDLLSCGYCRRAISKPTSPQGAAVSPGGGMHHSLDSALFGAGETPVRPHRHRRNTGRLDALSPLLKESGIMPHSAAHSRTGSSADAHSSGGGGGSGDVDDLDVVAAMARCGLHSQDRNMYNSTGGNIDTAASSRRGSALRSTHPRTRTSALLEQWAAAAAGGDDGGPPRPSPGAGDNHVAHTAPRHAAHGLSTVFAALHMSRLAASNAPPGADKAASAEAAVASDSGGGTPTKESVPEGDGDSSASSHRSVSPPLSPAGGGQPPPHRHHTVSPAQRVDVRRPFPRATGCPQPRGAPLPATRGVQPGIGPRPARELRSDTAFSTPSNPQRAPPASAPGPSRATATRPKHSWNSSSRRLQGRASPPPSPPTRTTPPAAAPAAMHPQRPAAVPAAAAAAATATATATAAASAAVASAAAV